MRLNPEQERAKNHINGPLLILAGAGSGKTLTLTARIEHMILSGINPASILALTFTNKAAREMKDRVSRVLGIEYQVSPYKNKGLPMIGTFHSVGVYILKEKIETIGMSRDFVIYDEEDKLSIIKSIIKDELQLDEKKYSFCAIANQISNAKNTLISAKDYEKHVDSYAKEIVSKVYLIYEKKLTENNALDFDDILLKTLKILQIPENLYYYQEKWKYIMIDEYQDTNPPQYEIVKLLASKYKNLAVVGDDWQSIYSWRGADVRNIMNFEKDYPEALVIRLEQNYRSTKNIINAANKLIKNNKSFLDKTLFTNNEAGEKIIYISAPTDKLEAETVARIIKEKKDSYKSNLVLYRANFQSRVIEEAFVRHAIPYRVVGGLKFYDRMEIKDILSYLRVIHNPNDVLGIKRIINTPPRKIGAKTIKKIDEYKTLSGLTYLQIFENIKKVEAFSSQTKEAVFFFYKTLLLLMEASKEMEVSSLIDFIIKKIGYEEYLRSNSTKEEYEARIENLKELKNVASNYNGMDSRDGLAQFLEEIALVTNMDDDKDEGDFVTLMTIHNSKGLEYDRVFIVGLEEGLFPSSKTLFEPSEIEEERRLMYVAMTRAKKELYISRALRRFHNGSYIENLPSRFIKEIDLDYIKDYIFSSQSLVESFLLDSYSSIKKEASTFRTNKFFVENEVAEFGIGDKVTHPKFGLGIIISLSSDLAEIKFETSGVRKMNIKIAPIKKL